ncbi:CHASE2 domain-containing protein [Ideonella sp. A 288]|uniref:CHASE2 domain-containing protein n=1 Tax=Ideonella sp. A 288 TaxID=1962181 RepID=UPI001303EF9F|nr:CHASE2 domain-containing protein [Ideonella sp. A 288]
MSPAARHAGAAGPGFLARWRDELAIAAVLAALASVLALGGWTWRLDRVVYDFGLTAWQRPAPPGIVIVAIDDASVEAIGRWPWRRAVHASLMERLAVARPKAVALDLVLSEPDPDPVQDVLLARALVRAAPVIVPVVWTADRTRTALRWESGPPVPLEPAALLRPSVRLGTAESAVDADGVLRHAFLQAGPSAAPYPHLALALLEAGGESVHPRVTTLKRDVGPETGWLRDGQLLIRYVGPPGTVDRVSYVDVLQGTVPAERLAGRYVLVGMTAQGLGDTLATPVNASHQAMPGIEVLANTLYTLRSGDAVRPVDDRTLAAGSALALLALTLSFGRFGPRVALPTAVASVPLAVLASLLSLNAGLWWSPVPYALAALLAYPLWSWRRLERAVAGLDQEIQRLGAEALLPGERPAVAVVSRVDGQGDVIEARLQTLQRAGTLVRQARQFLADSLAAMPTAMMVGDEQARVVLANPKAAVLFEVESAEDLHGLDLVRLLGELTSTPPFDWPAAIAALKPGADGLAVEGHLRDAGDYVVHVAAVDLQGLHRLIVTLADLRPVKQAQREREEALAFVSHDLRSPANAIVLLADLHLKGQACMPQDDLLREMRRLASRTLALSDDFVRAAQAQTQALAFEPVSAGALVSAAVADLQPQAAAGQVAVSVQSAGPDIALMMDRPLMLRAIGNLLANAIRHSPVGGRVQASMRVQDGRWVLCLRDEGPGLSDSQLAQLARGDEGAAVRDPQGVGLGLLFVQRVARRHAGSLRAGRAPGGGGAQFELALPLALTVSGGATAVPPPDSSGNP